MRSRRSTLLVPAALVALVVVAAACGGGSDQGAVSTTSIATTRPATDPLCVTAKQIFDLDQRDGASFDAALKKAATSADPASFQTAMKELESAGDFDSLLTAYDHLAELVPEANRAQVAMLRDYTSRLFDQVIAMPSAAELQRFIDTLQSSSDTVDAGKAALALDDLTYRECGQHLSSQ